MSSRNAAAGELQAIIEQIQALSRRGERLADATGGLCEARHFRSVMVGATLAAGDLHSKGLLLGEVEQ